MKMCLNETYIKIRIGKYLSDTFPTKNHLKEEILFTTALHLNFRFSLGSFKHTGRVGTPAPSHC